MVTIEDFADDFEKLVDEYLEKGLRLKVGRNRGVLYLFDDTTTPLIAARNGIDTVSEFSGIIAKRHPFWSMLDSSKEITYIILERWSEMRLATVEVDEINEYIENLQSSLQWLIESGYTLKGFKKNSQN